MSHPLLGDPAAMSALGAALRRTAVTLAADGEDLGVALEDAAPGWTGPSAVRTRRRTELLAQSATTVAAALDACGRSLQRAATDLASSLAQLRSLEEAAAAAGLEVRDGSVERAWGITGVADGAHAADAERVRADLQERVRHVVTAIGRHDARLAAECEHGAALLRESGARLRG